MSNRLAIQVHYTAGPVGHALELALIGPYPTTTDRDAEIGRLRSLAGGPITPWAFEPAIGDRCDADLWAYAYKVAARTVPLSTPEGLLRSPETLLELFRDPTDGQRGWYSVDRGGFWADVRVIRVDKPVVPRKGITDR
jgi:hypothetical protein